MTVVVAPEERWLPVVGWDGLYEVSDQGRVLSVRTGLMKSLAVHTISGYHMVTLKSNGRRKTYHVHRLVLDAFVGPLPDGLVSCHNNGDPQDNRLANLRYDTPSANNFDKVRHGKDHNTNKTHCPAGHEYTPENIRPVNGRKWRQCIICARKRQREYMRRVRATHKTKEGV